MKRIIVFTGHTGAGKSALAKLLSIHYHCSLLSFSSEGRLLSMNVFNKIQTSKIENIIFVRIIEEIKNNEMIIVDGISSIEVINKLNSYNYHFLVINIVAPYLTRIKRIIRLHKCRILDAIDLEKEKEKNKNKSGLKKIIALSHYTLYNKGDIGFVYKQAKDIIDKEELINEQ